MSGVRFSVNSGNIATGTPGPTTMLQVVAAANHRVKVNEIGVSFEGIDPEGQPILVEILRQTTAGTSSAATPVKINPADDETLQVTAIKAATVEPTAGDVLDMMLIHPQTGRDWQAVFAGEFIVPGGTRLGVRVSAAASVNGVATIKGEE